MNETRKQKYHNSLKLRYNDENYNLYGSDSFKQKMLKKYGDEHYSNREKAKQTMLKKYGVDHNFKLLNSSENSKRIWKEHHDDILLKIKETSLERYNCESPNQNPEIKKRQQESAIKHYGSLKNAYKIRFEGSKQTKKQKYGDEFYHNKEQAKQTLLKRHALFEHDNNCTQYKKVIKKYGQGWLSLNIPYIYNGRFRYISNEYLEQIKKYSEEIHNLQATSNEECELYNYLKTLTHKRIYKNVKNKIKDDNHFYELDMYIPSLNLAFEFNGTYWHSTIKKDKFYHQTKTLLCYKNNIQLIHIYEFEWIKDKDLIKNNLKRLFNNEDCSNCNWISLNDYSKYTLSEPELLKIKNGNSFFYIYNEGKFIKK